MTSRYGVVTSLFWVLCHFTGVLDWFEVDISAHPASSFRVICVMSTAQCRSVVPSVLQRKVLARASCHMVGMVE